MRYVLAIVALSTLVQLLAGVTRGQEQEKTATTPTIELPEKIAAKVGRLFVVEIKSNCKELAWEIVGNISADGVPLQSEAFREFTDPSMFRLRIICYGQGVYHLTVSGALGDKVAQKRCVILAGAGETQAGTDLLTKTMQAAFLKDTDPNKYKHAQALAKIFAESPALVNNPNLKTTAEVEAALAVQEGKVIGDHAFIPVRKVIRAELNWTLGPDAIALTPQVRGTLQGLFARFETALKSLEQLK